jgi:hypothetical protein
MAWRRRWWVHVWTGASALAALSDDREGVRQVHVHNVAALGGLSTRLRADPTVRRWTFGPFDELDKTGAPTHCRCGREFDDARAYVAEYRWRLCVNCPGHEQYHCRGCGQVTMWPVPGPECRPSKLDRQRRPPPYPGGP